MRLPTGKPAELLPLFHPDEPRKVYNTLVMLAYFLDLISPGHHWKQRLGTRIGQHIMDVEHMGLPPEWEQQAFWLDAAYAR